MNTLPNYNSVVIVGAGPSGLMMAAQLLRFGLNPIIIDSKTSATAQSRALAVHARSIEIFRQIGLDAIALGEGNIVEEMVLHHESEELTKLELSKWAEGKTRFPFILILEQSKTERILIDYITGHACPIYWNTELKDLHQTDTLVNLKVSRNGHEQLISSDWLIGADGASSKVRKSLHIPFSGGTYNHKFFLADMNIPGSSPSKSTRMFLQEEGFTGILPMKDANFRFIGALPRSVSNIANVTFEELKPFITYNLGFPMTGVYCKWFSTYQLHHRMADRFFAKRSFLIGDAAHVHSPVGGQGMNTGLQDAYNLAWKLTGVIKGKYSVKILESYSEERMPVARTLLKTTDRLFTLAIGQGWFIKGLRNWILPLLLKGFRRAGLKTRRSFDMLSQVGISYRSSSLSVHHSLAKKIKAGDRLPYIKFFDEKLKKDIDLHEWCNHNRFMMLVLGTISARDILAIGKWIQLNYPFDLSFFYLPFSERNRHLFDCFEMLEHSRKAIIIRPDMHIGYINDVVDMDLIGGYFQETFGWK